MSTPDPGSIPGASNNKPLDCPALRADASNGASNPGSGQTGPSGGSRHAASVRAAHALGYRVTPDGVCLGPTGKPRRPYVAPNKPYGLITFRLEGRWAKFYVHKLAAYQLFGEAALAQGTQVRHLNGNSLDNAPSNLALGTALDNNNDKTPEKKRAPVVAAALVTRKLKPEQVREFMLMWMRGASQKTLRVHFGLLKSTVSEILQGKIYSELTGIPRPERAKRSQEAA